MFYNHSKNSRHFANKGKDGRLPVATVIFAAIASLPTVPQAVQAGPQASCNTYYVSTTGSDANAGTIDKPFASIASAAKKMQACDTLYVRGGIYKQYGITVANKGTANAPISILAYPNELPVFDGDGMNINGYTPFIWLSGEYITLSGFEMRNGGVGVSLLGAHNTVSNMNVHHVLQHGITAPGDFSIVQNSIVSFASMYKYYNPTMACGWAAGISAGRDKVNGITDNAILRGNTVYSVYGEGLSTFEANGTIMENNVVYDNWATNTYISDASNVIFRNNLVYNTPNNSVGKRSAGLTLADEQASKPRSSSNIVINNMFLNANVSAFSWTIVSGSGLVSALIANNTLINGTLMSGPINKASVIKNNLVYRNDGGLTGQVSTRSGLSLSNNLWSSAPSANASGPGDVIGDPKLALAGVAIPGQVTKSIFAIPANSPAIGKGAAIYAVTNNYLVSSQNTSLNIGAYAGLPVLYLDGMALSNANE
jgi:hypothetical protein